MSTTPRTPLTLAALATVAIPGLDVVATRPPGRPSNDFDVAGLMDSQGRRWIVRAPTSAAAGAALEAEVEILTALARAADADALTFDVPRPQGFAPLPEGGRAMVYRELPGRSLDVDALTGGPGLTSGLGQAIAQVHELDTAVVADAGLPVYDAQGYQRRRLAELDEAARTGHVPAGLLRRWEAALEDVRLWRFRATVVHGDLAAEHILVADEEISALLDWAEARVADPADDLSWLLAAAPEDTGAAILSAYGAARTDGTDQFLADRALLASELALARWLMHGVRQRDDEVIEDAVQMLHDLDAAVADAPPIGFTEPASVAAEPDAETAGTGNSSDIGDRGDEGASHTATLPPESAGTAQDLAATSADPAPAAPSGEPDAEDDQDVTAPFPPPSAFDDDASDGPSAATEPDELTGAGSQESVGSQSETAEPNQADLADPTEAGEDTTEIPAPDLLEPDYRRRPDRAGIDDSPTSEFPASRP